MFVNCKIVKPALLRVRVSINGRFTRKLVDSGYVIEIPTLDKGKDHGTRVVQPLTDSLL